jgi:cold shock CspA family protein
MSLAAITGVVEQFDAAVGLGIIRTATGEAVPFHCIEIADGTRTIDVGAAVAADRIAKFGRYEAADIRRV